MRPTAAQAADHSATTGWLQAVQDAGTTDVDAVAAKLDGRQFEDMFARHAEWRASDHMIVHHLYVVEVLPAAKLAGPHGWCRVLAMVPAATAFPVGMECHLEH